MTGEKRKMRMSENIEEYLEVIWNLKELKQGKSRKDAVRIKEIADALEIAPPSVVEMLKKLERDGSVNYLPREGIKLTEKGEKKARQVVRNHRLAELLVEKTLNGKLDESIACGMEHHISEEFADALCISLNHPAKCPHGKEIPPGKCCEEAKRDERAEKAR